MVIYYKRIISYWQVALVFLAFIIVIGTSYLFISNTERKHLKQDAENVLNNTNTKIETDLDELKTLMGTFSETIRGMIVQGEDYEKVSGYLKSITEYMSDYGNVLSQITDVYGIFDVFDGKFYTNMNRVFSDDYAHKESLWHKMAVEANGNIVITEPYFDTALGINVITYARRILDNNGKPLGVICMDMKLDEIRSYVTSMRLTESSYGILFNKQFEIIAHPSQPYLGKFLRQLNGGVPIENALKQGINISERQVIDYLGNQSIAFIRRLENGWYLTVLTPYGEYYKSLNDMAKFLSVLGFIMAVVLNIILLRVTAAKNELEKRTRVIFDNVPFGSLMFDKNHKIMECNKEILKLFELSSKREYIDKFYELSSEHQAKGRTLREKITEIIEEAFEDGYSRFEWMHQKLNGEPIPCEITLIRVEYGDDNVLLAYIRDLRESKRMMKEIEKQSLLLNTVNRAISVLLNNYDENSFENALLKSFEYIGQCLDVDRVQIWRNEMLNDELYFVHRHEWLSEYGQKCIPVPIGLHFPYDMKPEWRELFLRNECINSPISNLPQNDQNFLSYYEMKSIVIIPLFLDDKFWGFFSIDDCRNERTFSKEEMEILTSAGIMMSNAVNRNLQITKIREAEERAQIIINNAPMGSLMIDKKYNIIECNKEILKLLELSSKRECIDKFYELSPEYQPNGKASREKIVEYIDKTFEKGYSRFEWMHQKLNGELIPCEIMLTSVKYKEDFIVVGYIRDLRGLKTMLNEIYEESEKSKSIAHWYNSILNAIPLPITVTDADTKWTFINTAVERFLGITLQDAIGKPCSNWNAHICNTEDCGIACAKRGLKQTYFSEGDSSYQVDVAMLKDLDNKTIGYIEVVQDITNLKQMAKKQAEAEAASLTKSAFLAKMSHEIRTPMNAILGITGIHLEDDSLAPKTLDALNKIYVSANLLLNIINDILDLSKVEFGKLELILNKYDVASMIYDTVQLNMIQFSNKDVDFVLNVDPNMPTELFGDELRIKQLLNNLLTNAFKYTDKGKVELSIHSEWENENSEVMLIFKISDTGQGMTEEQTEKIFDEYLRFNLEVNRTIQGTGLGMSIVKHLVQMMKGEIFVESKIGEGTTFKMKIPQGFTSNKILGKELVESLQNFRFIKASQVKSVRIEREPMPYGSVLVVDDAESNLYVAKGLLQPYKLSIDTADNGIEAIEKVKSGKVYDIIFMDHMMPKMDGVEAAKIMRESGYSSPIIALTANAIIGQAEILLKSGFDDFISKPIDIRQLNAILNKFIRDKQNPEVIKEARRQYEISKISTRNIDFKANPVLQMAFIRDAKKKFPILSTISKNIDSATDEDLQLFTINVHAMKSALANVGEKTLSNVARKLEAAGKDGNRAVISADTEPFLDNLRKFIQKLESVEDAELSDEEDIAYLRAQLLKFQSACAAYDKKLAKKVLTEFYSKQWSRQTKEFLDVLSKLLLHSDFEGAVSKTNEFMELCK
jgi:PAS domain S-box-containing protein